LQRQAPGVQQVMVGLRDTWRQLDVSVRDVVLTVLVTLLLLVLHWQFGPNAASMCHDGTIDAQLCNEHSPWVDIKVHTAV
jgi:hypothetical protein